MTVALSPVRAEQAATPRPEITKLGAIADMRFNPLPNVAGAAIAAGHAGEPIWSKSYGLGDIATQTPLDPERTSFHVASVTKLVTAIAIMQLVDRGQLSLDDEVNARLPVPLLHTVDGKTVRIRHLLTHTAGLATDYLNLAVTDPNRVMPLLEYLKTHLPAQIAAPGERTNYSNHGYGILGAVIEAACRCTYGDYVQREIFDRAGLARSAINTHVRATGLNRATGYFYREKTIAEPQLYEHMSAAGAALMSLPDVVKLLLALDAGELMSPAAAAQLTKVQFTNDARLGGGYGFGFWRAPGYRTPVWLCGGDVPGQSTRVLYMPEHRFAAVVAVNRKDSYPAEGLLREVLKPYEAPVSEPGTTQSGSVAGQYRYAGYPHGNFLKLGALFNPVIDVADHARGLRVAGPRGKDAVLWKSIEKDVFQREGTNERIVFRTQASGARWAYMDTFEAGPVAFEFVPPLGSSAVWVVLFALTLVIAAVCVVGGCLRLLLWGRTARIGSPLSATGLLASTTVVAAASLFVWSFHEIAVARDDRFAYEPLPLAMIAALYLPYAGVPAALWYASQVARSWRGGTALAKVAAAVTILALGAYWGLVWEWRMFAPAKLTGLIL